MLAQIEEGVSSGKTPQLLYSRPLPLRTAGVRVY